MSDAIDDALDNEDAEDETEDLTNQVPIFASSLLSIIIYRDGKYTTYVSSFSN